MLPIINIRQPEEWSRGLLLKAKKPTALFHFFSGIDSMPPGDQATPERSPQMRCRKNWMTACAVVVGLCVSFALSIAPAVQAQDSPRYKLDGNWPKPLPVNWTIMGVTGMFVDKSDNIWVLNRPRDLDKTMNFATLIPPTAECCVPPPAVLEFNVEGDLLRSWGGPNFAPGWPASEHTIFVDKQGNVWLGGARSGDTLLKFTADGKFISDFGHRGPAVEQQDQQKQDNQQTDLLLRGTAAAELDEGAHELYIADGYLNKRMIVYDSNTGAYKRGWGAYGIPLDQINNDPLPPRVPGDPPAKQFREPVHCVHISNDGLVYVCDRGGDRIQVFTKQGKFLKEFPVANNSGNNTAGSINFSPDPQQKYLYVADMMNSVVWILNRNDGSVAGRIGHAGHLPGQFHMLHVATADSQGNIYTGEVATGARIQKFVPAK